MNELSMFTITGTVLNTFEAPGRKANEKQGIEAQEAKPKVQILGEMPVPGEQTRMELVTLTCEDQREYEALRGQTVAVPLGIFAPARGQIIYYIPKGAHPTVVRSTSTASVQSPIKSPIDEQESGPKPFFKK